MDGVTTVPDLDALWDALWADLRRNATGKPSGDAIIHRHRAAIEAEARASQPLTLDVERVARALFDTERPGDWPTWDDYVGAFGSAGKPPWLRKAQRFIDEYSKP